MKDNKKNCTAFDMLFGGDAVKNLVDTLNNKRGITNDKPKDECNQCVINNKEIANNIKALIDYVLKFEDLCKKECLSGKPVPVESIDEITKQIKRYNNRIREKIGLDK